MEKLLNLFKKKENKEKSEEEIKAEAEEKKFFEAVKFKDNTPDTDYSSGTIQGFLKASTDEKGNYKPYGESLIKETKENLDKIYEEMDKDKDRGVTVSREHSDPEGWRKEKEEKYAEDDK
jgi:hypothetical protein